MSLRPEVQALINRGHVEIDEISNLGCSREESTALIPALSDIAIAQRIWRTLVHLPKWSSSSPAYLLKSLMPEVCRRLENEPAQMPMVSNRELSLQVDDLASHMPQPADPGVANSYIDQLVLLSADAAERLRGGV